MKYLFIVINIGLLWACSGDTLPDSKPQKDSSMPLKSTKNYVIASPMEGVLMQNNKPLANTKIFRSLKWNGNNDGIVEEFITDENGYFLLPKHEEQLELGMLNQFVGKMDIEFETKNNRDYLWTSSKFFPEIFTETNGKVEELICDTDIEEIAVPMGPSSILTKCRWKNMPE